VLAVGASTAANYPTLASREQQMVGLAQVPWIGALFGTPIGIDRLGGLVSWRDGILIAISLGLWSIVALSGTLAGEVRAGSFEVLGNVPIPRWRIALEKVTVHLASLELAVLLMAAIAWLTGLVFAVLPGDAIAFVDAIAEFVGLALIGLVAGAIAFALAPFVGRAPAAGLAAVALFLAYLVTAYAGLVPAFASLEGLSWFTWTADQRPLAGSWDVASLVPVVGLIALLLAIGVVAVERRDLGTTVPLPSLALPGRRFLLRGPARQAHLGSRARALAWGLAIGTPMGLFALSGPGITDPIKADPGAARFIEQVFSGINLSTTGGVLQLAFVWFGYLLMALVAATLVDGLTSDERERRLDLLLSTPVSRGRWLVAGGMGLYGSLALLTLVVALLTALGAAAAGQDAVTPFVGVWVGGLYAAALVGIALTVLGLGAVELAAAVPAALALGFYVWDVIGSALRLPEELVGLSLTHHLGQPMAGTYDWPGMLLLAALAAGGLLVGGWGLRRRDLST
jgi:ABC-2 type transport system permease protein